MNLYVIAEEFYNDMRIMTGALTYMEALKKSNEMKREFPNRNFNVIMAHARLPHWHELP